jgi:hypothetical protein
MAYLPFFYFQNNVFIAILRVDFLRPALVFTGAATFYACPYCGLLRRKQK